MDNFWIWTTIFFYLTTGFWMMSSVLASQLKLPLVELSSRERIKFALLALIWLPICVALIVVICKESIELRVESNRNNTGGQ